MDRLSYVDSANQELDALGKMNLRHEAVADKKFEQQLGKAVEQGNSTSTVTLTAYEPNELKYDVTTGSDALLVFSEIYYPGWTATIDGKPAELGRVNYILRALNVPKGSHKVVLSFFPKSVDTTETIAYVAFALLIVALIAACAIQFRRKKAAPNA